MDSRILELDLKTSLTALLDLFLPRTCVVCGRPLLPQERHICLECLADLPETHFAQLERNPMADRLNERIQARRDALEDGAEPLPVEPYSYAAALYFYNGNADYRKISQALKYGRDFAAGRFFAGMLGDRLAVSEAFADVDVVVPVPLHRSRRLQRGYNQAEIIAEEVVKRLGRDGRKVVMDAGLLKRVRRTQTQTTLTVAGKEANVAGAFVADKSGSKVKSPVHLLLVDDVFTTGATIYACHAALREEFGYGVRISAATLGFVSPD